jgi:hypothetical protein
MIGFSPTPAMLRRSLVGGGAVRVCPVGAEIMRRWIGANGCD